MIQNKDLNIIDLNENRLNISKTKDLILKELDEVGYVIVRNNEVNLNEEESYHKYFLESCSLIGKPVKHNKDGNIIWDIKKKENCGEVKTFSEHSEEASLHTDSQYRKEPEDFMSLLMLSNASCGGGRSKTMLLKDIIEEINLYPNSDEILNTLKTEKFPFAVPSIFNEGSDGEIEYIFEPIIKNNKIRFRIDTLEKALMNNKNKISKAGFEAFQILKKIILTSKKVIYFDLKDKDILFVNNKTTLHGRTSFKDSNRHLLRIRMNRYE